MSTPSATPAIEFGKVVKCFGSGAAEVRALTDVSLHVPSGQFIAVMGPSGCGKSTLLHLAGALEEPTAGSVRIEGRDISALSFRDQAELRRCHIGYVFQQLNLIPSLTALENVMLPLELDGVPTRQARAQATDALHAAGLREQLDRYPDDFSGGQRQRIAIARAVIGDRRILLADEPTGALDTVSSDEVVRLLADLCAERGTTVVMVTHEPRLASWAQRTIFLRDGRIVDDSDPAPTATASSFPGNVP